MPEPKLKEKRWSQNLEATLFKKWQDEKLYGQENMKEGPVFVVDTPPPYPSGRWHVGGALHFCQIDMISRYFRMKEKNLWFPVGIDRNGLPIESRVEKDFGIKAHEVPREEFLKKCRETLNKYESNISNIMNLTGLSVDWSKVYRTDSPKYRTLTQSTFIELWNKGLIYEDTKPNNWCPGCKTTLADAEVEYRSQKGKLVFINFKLKEGGVIQIATTRPELLGACQAITVHPTGSAYSKEIGKTALVPIYGREVKIIGREETNPEFGTGAMMVCSYGDQEDVKMFREFSLPETIIIDEAGKMTKAAGKYEGLSAKDAKKAIIEDLNGQGFIEKIDEVDQNIPICWRSKDDIELIALPEYYLKQVDFVDDVKKISDDIEFHPEKSRQLLLDWLGAVNQDWPISRRRFYGTPVPIFDCGEHGKFVPEPGKYYETWNMTLPCPKCNKPAKGDTRVLDTWMDSSISALWVSGFKRDEKFFKRSFPTFLRPQGKDIVRTWLYYTLLRVYHATGKKAFNHVWISGHIVDKKGFKMSKSIGNVVYPEPLIEKYGADSLRFFSASEAKLGSDIRVSEERIAGAAKFIQKLYNVSRFISMFSDSKKPEKLEPADKWILSELGKLTRLATRGYDDMDLFIPANEVRTFVWEKFAPHYIEMVKGRAYDGDESARYTLHTVLRQVLKLLSPISPFITDYVYRKLYEKTLQFENFDSFEENQSLPTTKLIEFNESVWAKKKAENLSLRDEVALKVPERLQAYEKDLIKMHNLRQ